MVMGVLFSGIFTGLVAAVGALTFGFPIWLAVVLYPIIGTFGAVGFISLALRRAKESRRDAAQEFATE